MNRNLYLLKCHLGKLGGLEKYTWRIASGFAKRGLSVTLITAGTPKDTLEHTHLHFHTLPCHARLSVFKIQEFDKKVSSYLKKSSCDLIFGMDRNRFQTHLRLGNGIHRAFLETRAPTDSFFKRLVTPLNPLHRLILSMEKEAIEHPKLRCLFTNSHMVKNEVLRYYKVDPQKIHVVHNGVEWYELQRDFETWVEKKTALASQLHLDPTTYHFLFIGNGYKRKGLDVLLHALSLLPHEDFHLSVLGKEKHLSHYLAKTHKLGLSKKVSFYGQTPDVRKFYQLCDSLVIPSFYDPFANVTVEALAMGLLVVSSRSNGGHEVLTPDNGLTLDTLLDLSCLAEALKKALSHPKTYLRSQSIRNSIKHLDFSHQISSIIETTVKT
ncbi:MAG: glycosyltransferase family 4 protein [Chlamydiae bacterium]|nr:glycosyltransferase family 4 protein [Chlamydiota bacterium]